MKLLLTFAIVSVFVAATSGQTTAEEYRKMLESNPKSSMAHYGLGGLLFEAHDYQSSALEYRAAENGDLQPAWIEVWSHINLGKIFDATGQRDRAINEYTQAARTRDDTNGALKEADRYLKSPYKP